jgi:hypothetical protein
MFTRPGSSDSTSCGLLPDQSLPVSLMMTTEPSVSIATPTGQRPHIDGAPNLCLFLFSPSANLTAKILLSVGILLCRVLVDSHDLSDIPCSNRPSTQNRAAVSTVISWAANAFRVSTDSTESKAKFYLDRSSLELPWNAAYDLALLPAQYFQLFVVACAPLPHKHSQSPPLLPPMFLQQALDGGKDGPPGRQIGTVSLSAKIENQNSHISHTHSQAS